MFDQNTHFYCLQLGALCLYLLGMTPKPGKPVSFLVIAVFGLGVAWLAYSLWSEHLQARRDVGYRALLSQYQRDLHPGMTRATVTDYLEAHHVRYGEAVMGGSGNAWSYQVRIGTDTSGSFACANWEVYIAFDFDNPKRKIWESRGETGDASDVLRDIRIFRFCW